MKLAVALALLAGVSDAAFNLPGMRPNDYGEYIRVYAAAKPLSPLSWCFSGYQPCWALRSGYRNMVPTSLPLLCFDNGPMYLATAKWYF